MIASELIATSIAYPSQALVGTVASFSGVIIFLSSHMHPAALDQALVPYIRQVTFPAPSPEAIRNRIRSFLDGTRYEPYRVESREKMVGWLVVVAESLKLSLAEIRNICQHATNQAHQEGRLAALGDIIKALTKTTGRLNEWDFVTDTSLYACGGNQAAEGATTPNIAEGLLEILGHWSEIPDDGRLPLAFSSSFSSTVDSSTRIEGIKRLNELTKRLLKVGSLSVIDWGWPGRLWCATYPGEDVEYWPTNTWKPPREQWEKAGFTFGLRGLLDSKEYGSAKCGSPWRRLV
jgi:hypothetical protein